MSKSPCRSPLYPGYEMLASFRQTVTIKRVYMGIHDPATHQFGDAVLTNSIPGSVTAYDASLIDGVDILCGDVRCVVAGRDLSFTPHRGDTVYLTSGETWRVARATGDFYDLSAYHELTLRR